VAQKKKINIDFVQRPVEQNECEVSSQAPNEVKRAKWGNQIEFILSSISYAVGLGNIWRFPYLCYRNGGGAFLIPYCIMLFVCGMPLMFFELCLGQFGREGPITVWKISPLFTGIGYAMFMISFYIGCYYNVVLAWAIYYIYSSFTHTLPWSTCDGEWSSDFCNRFNSRNCTLGGGLMNITGYCVLPNMTSEEEWNTLNATVSHIKSPAHEFFHNHVLDIGASSGLHDLGGFQGKIVLSLLFAWLIVYLVLLKGVESFGKVVYFTATFPYMILIILLIRACTLPGYIDGVTFYLTPDWEKLKSASVWGDAAIQIFFSLSPCWGGLITLASYNKFSNNCFRFGEMQQYRSSFHVVFALTVLLRFATSHQSFFLSKYGIAASYAFVHSVYLWRIPIVLWVKLYFNTILTYGFFLSLGTNYSGVTFIFTSVIQNL
ncbi:unnamed protein product, partial [Meganyctiphanes norvegica]